MELFSALLVLSFCGKFTHSPHKGPVTRSLDVSLMLATANSQLNKRSSCCWFETPLRPLRRHYYERKKRAFRRTITWNITFKLPHFPNDSVFITVTSLWSRWSLKSQGSRLFTQPFLQVQQRKHQSSTTLAFVRGIPCDWWIPLTKGQ